jgi:phosphopantetheine adenylyltransferase
MVILEERKVKKIQLNEVSMEFVCKLYRNLDDKDTVLVIYNGDEYFTNVSYDEICRYNEEKDLIYFVKYLCREKSISFGSGMYEDAESIFKKHSFLLHLMLEESYKDGKMSFLFNTTGDIRKCNRDMEFVRDKLREEGISAFLVAVPDEKDIIEKNRHSEWRLNWFTAPINWTEPNRCIVEKYLHKITELDYENVKRQVLKRINKVFTEGEKEKNTIFLVGLCIVEGWENFKGESLVEILYEKLLHYRIPYKVQKISLVTNSVMKAETILQYDIKKNDIVIFINYYIDKKTSDLDLTEAYNNYNGEKWLYTDIPIHTTKVGNEIIADALIENIIESEYMQVREDDNQVVAHSGEKCEEKYILDYVDEVKKNIKDIPSGSTIGACVMTCNPFTLGHLHLIEYASACVDYLYVFVVEDDQFFFTFKDRMNMVKKGTAALKNVIVLPSGEFMISRTTFKSYFEKEEQPNAVIDAVKDVNLFKKYIAPALGIVKRFVGEEPECAVTAQYNQLLKQQLAEDIEVIEIPRKETSGQVISASNVRNSLNNRDWQGVRRLVPHTTLEYIKANYKRILDEHKTNKQSENYIKVKQFIQEHHDIVICGLGNDAKELIWNLGFEIGIEDIEKLEFYDEKLSYVCYSFMGKKILNFEELIEKYKHYYMVVATRKFKEELFYELTQNGVELGHIIVFTET